MTQKIVSENLSNNEVISGNFSQNKLIDFDVDFNGLEKTVSLFFPSVRNAFVERYKAETFLKIGLKAQDIIDRLGIEVKPIPPKAALPLFEKMSLEHEEDMYDLWAKLLVNASIGYDPMQIQYAEILSKIGSNEARLLKDVFEFLAPLHDWETEERFNSDKKIEENNLQKAELARLIDITVTQATNYKKDEWEDVGYRTEINGLDEPIEKPDFSYLYKIYGKNPNCILEELITYEGLNSLDLLQSLNLIKYEYIPAWKIPQYIEDKRTHIRIFLTSFGYRFVLSLEFLDKDVIESKGMST